ncbi:hypothetical protein EVAR_61486_1 [Eumeta japonica]|uniref:Uncharacterized protein n=1 Tax=Eumeta variegata TaxID=151549 RepID=A0A4C1ZFZ2_EUMVA|nr:hypothetical protein EVAR_61486_1 [Eumeta japonica]
MRLALQWDIQDGKLSEALSRMGDCTSLQPNHRFCTLDDARAFDKYKVSLETVISPVHRHSLDLMTDACNATIVFSVRKEEKPLMGRPCARAHRCIRLSQTKNLLNNLYLQWRMQNAVTATSQTRQFRHGDAVGA